MRMDNFILRHVELAFMLFPHDSLNIVSILAQHDQFSDSM